MEKTLYKSRIRVVKEEVYPFYYTIFYNCLNSNCYNYERSIYLVYKGEEGDIVEFICPYCSRTWIEKIEI